MRPLECGGSTQNLGKLLDAGPGPLRVIHCLYSHCCFGILEPDPRPGTELEMQGEWRSICRHTWVGEAYPGWRWLLRKAGAMECVEGKEKAVRDGRDALCVPRPIHTLSLPFSPPNPLCQDAETAMSQAVSPLAVTQVPSPSSPQLYSLPPAPVVLTSAMPIIAICLLWEPWDTWFGGPQALGSHPRCWSQVGAGAGG